MKGFMGKTHALLSVMLMCICMLVPIDFLKKTLWLLKDNILFFIVGMVVLIGGALLPDLDNSQSSAGHSLGFMGSICTIFMQSIATIVFTLFHKRSDSQSPQFPHRYFWHTLISGIGIFLVFLFGLKGNDETILALIKTKGISMFIMENTALLFFIIMLFIAVLCGSDMITYRIIKFFKLPKLLNYILPTIAIIYIFTIDLNHLRILGLCIGLGYIFHIIEDSFADSGTPLFFPIPIHKQLWYRIKLTPITIKTGSLANTILDLIILVIDIVLIAFVFLGGNL